MAYILSLRAPLSAWQSSLVLKNSGLLRRFAPRNDEFSFFSSVTFLQVTPTLALPARGRGQCRAPNSNHNIKEKSLLSLIFSFANWVDLFTLISLLRYDSPSFSLPLAGRVGVGVHKKAMRTRIKTVNTI